MPDAVVRGDVSADFAVEGDQADRVLLLVGQIGQRRPEELRVLQLSHAGRRVAH
jgi:hypothetical protein